MSQVAEVMVTLATGTQVPWTEFRTWSRQKQARSLVTPVLTPESRDKIGAANRGKTLSEETRARMGSSRRGRPRPQEVKDKLRAANLGKTLSDETRAKIKAASTGRAKSQESRAKMSAWHQANPNHPGSSRPIMTPTGQFPSIKAAGEWAQQHGLVNARNKIEKWLKTHPDQFYYLPKVSK